MAQEWLYQDGLKPLVEMDGQGRVVSRFVYATHANVPDYLVKGGQTYRVITDVRGSVRLVVNVATGNIAQQMNYDEYGQVTQDTNPGFQPFGYAGGLYDSITKLAHFGARDYDPSTGRWLSKDPIGFDGGSNWFAYCGNDPVSYLDPLGLQDGMSNPGNTEPLAELEAQACGERTATQKAKEALQNKLRHIFDKPQHKLDSVLKQFGGDREKAFNAMQDALKNQNLPNNQLFQTTVTTGSMKYFTVRHNEPVWHENNV